MKAKRHFVNAFYAKRPAKKYLTNKIVVYYIDDTWSKDSLHLNVYGPIITIGKSCIVVVFDNFWEF